MNYKRITAALSMIIILAAGCVDAETREKIKRDMVVREDIKSINSLTNSMHLVVHNDKIKVYYLQHWIDKWTMHAKYIVINEETGAVSITD